MPSLRHVIDLREPGDGIWEAVCSCGAGPVWTAWGFEAIKARCRSHLICNGLPVPTELWPDE